MAGLSPAEIAIPIRSVLSGHKNIDVLMAEVVEINLSTKAVVLEDSTQLHFDYLVFAVGATNFYFGQDHWAEHAPGLKSIEDALKIRRRVLSAFEDAEREKNPTRRRQLLTFAVIGGGPTGVELAGAVSELARRVLADDYQHIDKKDVRVVLIEGGDRILAAFAPELSKSAEQQLSELGVEVLVGRRVTDIDANGVELGELRVEANTVVWGAGVAPHPLAKKLGVPLDERGRVIVQQDCAVEGHRHLFAIGDVARFEDNDGRVLPGISPVAMQQGRYVAKLIACRTPAAERRPFTYLDKGMMATIGRSRAVAQTKRFRLSGLMAWIGWLLIHLWYLVGFKNRIFVLMQWVFSYVVYRRGARLITEPQSQRSTTKPRC